jgi:hypothetical protein
MKMTRWMAVMALSAAAMFAQTAPAAPDSTAPATHAMCKRDKDGKMACCKKDKDGKMSKDMDCCKKGKCAREKQDAEKKS